jgi:hypothetical protein
MFRVDNGGFPKSPEVKKEQGLLPRHDPSSTVYPFTLAFFSLEGLQASVWVTAQNYSSSW